jgi:serine/threonine protein phosphatase PrpC
MLRVTSFSEAGGHARNEDAFLVRQHPAEPDYYWLCMLADGQGGRSGGAEAAQAACRTAMEVALRQAPRALIKSTTWPAVLAQADQAVLAETAAGFTTLLGFGIRGASVAGASCGDSALLVVSRSKEACDLTKAQRKNPPVGSGEALFVPFSTALVAPWTVLAMSDGVWKFVGWERLVQAVTEPNPEPILETLQRAARLQSGRFPDDFTAVVFEETG